MIYGYENVCYYCESIFSQSVKCENKTFHKKKCIQKHCWYYTLYGDSLIKGYCL